MRSPRILALLLASYSALCLAQTTARYTVTGTVSNSATGEPIRRALVNVNGTLVFTGADGRFQVENVPQGQTMVMAQKPGYFNCVQVGCAGNFVMVHSGTNEVLIKLIPEANIQGRIVDEDGEPLRHIQVSAVSEAIYNGRKQTGFGGSANTDESGNYHIEKLMPGSYKIETAPRPMFFYYAAGPNYVTGPNSPPPEMYPRRYYPNAPDASAAQLMDLKGGQTGEADFTLTPVPAFRISGSISPPQGGISVTAEDVDGERWPLQAQFRQSPGKFVLPFVPAGTWTIHFEQRSYGPQNVNEQLYADITATVSSANIENLQVLLQPLPSVPVDIANASNQESGAVQVQLFPKESNGGVYGWSPQPDAGGPYAIRNVHPGRYSVVVFAPNQCVDSLTSGNIDLTRDDLVIPAGSEVSPINIGMRSDCAQLDASARSQDQTAKPTILLLPASRAIQPASVQIPPGVATTFNNLSPGEYQVYAFSNVDGLEYTNPDVMRQFSGQEITLSPNQHANLTLDIITR